jgi:glucosamine-6-phosphate deaminase
MSMEPLWVDGADGLGDAAAAEVTAALARLDRPVVALPTGATPRGLYERLVRRGRCEPLLLESARFFNLDEFVGLPASDPRSYASFLARHLFEPLAIPAERIRLLRGDASDLAAECRAYDRALAEAGGLDLAILGLGTNGHIAFNEPGEDWTLRTHVVSLADSTRRAQRLLFAAEAEVPRRGITMGIATIRAAGAVLLLVMGEGKAAALGALRAGQPDPAWPVTSLLGHPRLTILADRRLQSANGPADSGPA